ncbi:hypothetical protein GOODEAATRI_031256, partial [Goodea atripinnis]
LTLNLDTILKLFRLKITSEDAQTHIKERLFLTYDLTALDDRMYYEAGVLIGWSLAHGGPGPCCLHPALFE